MILTNISHTGFEAPYVQKWLYCFTPTYVALLRSHPPPLLPLLDGGVIVALLDGGAIQLWSDVRSVRNG